ncbi:translation initiation factor IF-2 [Tistrella bauzanensis]|uniref:Translation initiation factor IF-2 n=1 Tax=Tistrella arctica TaxID=3133430 RepID=A0ABU9YHF9_9PROT
MSETNEDGQKKALSLSGAGRLELRRKPAAEGAQVRQNFSHGRSKTVTVEVKRKRTVSVPEQGNRSGSGGGRGRARGAAADGGLTQDERDVRLRALEQAIQDQKRRAEEEVRRAEEAARRKIEDEARRKVEEEARKVAEEAARKAAEEAARREAEDAARREIEARAAAAAAPVAPAPEAPAPRAETPRTVEARGDSPRTERPAGGGAPRGDRPDFRSGDRTGGAPRGDRPGGAPRGDRPDFRSGDRPGGGAPRGDRPDFRSGDRPAGGAPRGDRPDFRSGDRPAGGAPRGDRPDFRSGDRPAGGAPRGDRPDFRSGDRPAGGAPRGDRPDFRSGDRPGGGAPRGDRPDFRSGDRPGGAARPDFRSGDRPGGPPRGDRPGGARPAAPGATTTTPVLDDDVERARARAAERARKVERDEEESRAKAANKRATPAARPGDDRRRGGKGEIKRLVEGGDEGERQRSQAAMRRQRERMRRAGRQAEPQARVIRDVIVPEVISVQELANRMAVRGGDVVKKLMTLGVMATINQAIDADTAELVATEFGHRVKRVAEDDVELGILGLDDTDDDLTHRAPVVTVMGHVDHGKTSLLDALRKTDVVAREAGGITQHIGAYQVELETGDHVTFLDTPGHAAFTAMRARGAQVTDIVVLVVAADDGVMPQTVEAINHAKAAGVPIVVAINKIDKPGVNPERVRNELLQHELVLEELGGDIIAVEVSAKTGYNLDKLLEAILLQAEVLELRANTGRAAQGAVVEAKLDKGRGPVATVLVQKGTLKTGDAFVVGSQWGRVRALIDDKGRKVEEAGPSVPVEILGLQGVPQAGDELVVVEDERKAREISDFRSEREQRARAATALGARGTVEQMLSEISAGAKKELPVLVKTDVQGSLEAITSTLAKLGNEEVAVRMLHGAVGGINESDVTLAQASNALIIGFNVRANAQARDVARQAGLELRYYSVIYDLTNDVKGMLEGMLAPIRRETITGQATIREVFAITKVGKIAGCMVTEGYVRRDSKVRLLRDDVVIHEGALSSLKRFKDDAKEVRAGQECGMAFENYQDLRNGDVIEAFEVEEIAAQLKSPI